MKKLFLCTCNNTINQTLDFLKIQKETTKLFDVIETIDDLCLEDGLSKLEQSISDEDRITIAACSSQIIEVPVKQRVKNDFISFVPLREHVAWVHPEGNKSATNKAIVLITDSSIRLDYLEQPIEFKENAIERVLVLGGGIAGLKAASDLHNLGIGVTLLEPLDQTDNKYVESSFFMSDGDTLLLELETLQTQLSGVERIKASLVETEGQLGFYEVTWKDSAGTTTKKDYGAIIVATGVRQFVPDIAKKYRYGKSDRVVTIETLLTGFKKKAPKDDSTILVVTDPEFPMCSAEGSHLLRSTELLARQGKTVFVSHSDIKTEDENLYRSARNSGVIFVRGRVTQVKEQEHGLTCRIENTLESMTRMVTVDKVAILQRIGPVNETALLASILGVDCDESGFIKTRYSKMKPVGTSRRGIFVAGSAKMPMGLSEALVSAQNAVLETLKIIRLPLERSGFIPIIDDDSCDLCKACIEACPNDALRLLEKKVIHIPVHCEFCGICVSSCPTRAIEFQSHSKESWFARLESIAKTHKRLEKNNPFSFVYACSECANASLDQAGFTGKSYSTGNYVIQFPCSGMVSPIEILKGLAVGADKVVVAHCPPGGCHHQKGDHHSELVVHLTRDMLREIGQSPDRIQVTYMMAAMPEKMQKEVGHLG